MRTPRKDFDAAPLDAVGYDAGVKSVMPKAWVLGAEYAMKF